MAIIETKDGFLKKLTFGITPTLVRHDYKRAVYRAFLAEFPPDAIRKYFEKVPLLIDGKEVSGKPLFELLWKKKAHVPVTWEVASDHYLEEFLVSQGLDPREMMPKILRVSGGSTPIPGKVILSWFYPKVEALFNKLDTRDMCFGLITLVTENWLPGRIHRRIRRMEKGEWVHNTLIFIEDDTHRTYLDWDYEFIAGPQVMEAPAKLGLPPFERFGMLADTRPPERVIWEAEDTPTWTGNRLSIRGEVVGEATTFSAYCKYQGIDVERFNPPETEVVVMSRDYFCPRRKRVVLHQGCAYGAPFFISWTEHRKLAALKEGVLTTLISDIDREEREDEADILEARHMALIDTLGRSATFVFHPADESMSLNGRHFVKGIPAKILRSVLQAHLQDGRTEFEYRDFKRDFEISLGQKNSNFEVRFYRLMEKLAEQDDACLTLEKTGRGCFSLQVRGSVKLQDSTPQAVV